MTTQNMLFDDMSDGSEVAAAQHRRKAKPQPASSHEANDRHTKSGKKRLHIEQITDLVWKHPSSTPGELAAIAKQEGYEGLDYIEIQRRVSECTQIHRSDRRRLCTARRDSKTPVPELMPGPKP